MREKHKVYAKMSEIVACVMKTLLTKTFVKAHDKEAQSFMQKCPKFLHV